MRAVQVGGWEHGAAISEALARDGLLAAACCVEDAGGLRVHDSLDSMMRSEKFDAAFVCSDVPDPAGVAALLLDAGKHVLMEGVVNGAGVERLSKIARRRSRVLAYGYAARFNATIRAAREGTERFGGPRVIILDQDDAAPSSLDDGMWSKVLVRSLDAAAYIFGRLPSVIFARSESIRREYDDFFSVVAGFGEGHTAVLTCSWFESHPKFTLDAICRDSRLCADFLEPDIPVAEEAILYAAQDFFDAIRSGGSPAVSPEYTTGIANAAESVLLSSRKGIPIYLEAS